jgi:hypothetical protein
MEKNKIARELADKLKEIDSEYQNVDVNDSYRDDKYSPYSLAIEPSIAWDCMFIMYSADYANEQKKRTSLKDRVKFHMEIVDFQYTFVK